MCEKYNIIALRFFFRHFDKFFGLAPNPHRTLAEASAGGISTNFPGWPSNFPVVAQKRKNTSAEKTTSPNSENGQPNQLFGLCPKIATRFQHPRTTGYHPPAFRPNLFFDHFWKKPKAIALRFFFAVPTKSSDCHRICTGHSQRPPLEEYQQIFRAGPPISL